MLKQIGVGTVEFATDGCEALKLLTTFSPNLVLTDIHMRHMDGIEFVKALRSLQKAAAHVLPVIFMSGDRTRSTKEQAMQLGSVSYVLKPLQIHLLREKIENALGISGSPDVQS